MSRELSVGWHELRDGSMSYWNGLMWTEKTPPPGTDGPEPRKRHWWQRR